MKREEVTVAPFSDPIKSKSDSYLARQREIDEVNARRAVVKAHQRDDEKKRAEAAESQRKAEYEKSYALAASQRLSPAQVEEVRAKIDQPSMSFIIFACPQCRKAMAAVHGQRVTCACGCVATVGVANSIGAGRVPGTCANVAKPDTCKIYGERVSWIGDDREQTQVNHPEGRPLSRYYGRVFMRDGDTGSEMTTENWSSSVRCALARRESEAKRIRAASVGWDPYADGEA